MSELKQKLQGTAFGGFSERALKALWLEFSAIQAGTELIVDGPAVERFVRWLETGDDMECWS